MTFGTFFSAHHPGCECTDGEFVRHARLDVEWWRMFRNRNTLEAMFEGGRTGDVTGSLGGRNQSQETFENCHLIEIAQGNLVRGFGEKSGCGLTALAAKLPPVWKIVNPI